MKAYGFNVLGAGARAADVAVWRRQPREQLRRARRFLFLQYETALGTAVHATPVFEALRKAVPEARIAVLSNGIPHEVLQYNPHIDSVVSTPHPMKHWVGAIRYFLFKVRPHRRQFDCVITDSGNRRSRLQLLSVLAGIRCRVGFRARYSFNHASVAYNPDTSILQNNLGLLGVLGHPFDQIEPSVFFTDSNVREITELFQQQGVSLSQPLVVFQTQTSGGEPNQWFEDRFVELADRFCQQTHAQIVFVGAKAEIARIESIRGAMKVPSFSAAGYTNIPGLAALLGMCDLLVTLDTGTMHVGRAVKVPMVVVAHAKAPEHEWLPPATEHIRVIRRSDVDCTTCRTARCLTRECMRRIKVSDVLEAALFHLQRFPVSIEARQTRLARCLRPAARTND